jgi:hypothetical protein
MARDKWSAAMKREKAFNLYKNADYSSKYPKLIDQFGDLSKRYTKVYETAKGKFRVYLFERSLLIASVQKLDKKRAIAQAKAWA